ncbi:MULTISPECIES: hypothetical protein [unclassified Paenibacillus]|uniref:hypothetical protein n=1 Tax=unclassified Paenibacillus TaxID=185978 RepID=UPI0030DCF458
MDNLMSEAQVTAIANELQRRVHSGEAKDNIVVVTLLSMAKAGRLSSMNINKILHDIYDDKVKILAVLIEAQKVIDEEMVNSIIKEVRAT